MLGVRNPSSSLRMNMSVGIVSVLVLAIALCEQVNGAVTPPPNYCAPGTYIRKTLVGYNCLPCASGRFSSTSNAYSCSVYRTCVAGQYMGAAGTASTDRACPACAAGTYSQTSSAVSCTAWKVCPPGMYESQAPSATFDRDCLFCPSNTYSSTNNVGSCTPHTQCTANEVESVRPTLSSNRQCVARTTTTQRTTTLRTTTTPAPPQCNVVGELTQNAVVLYEYAASSVEDCLDQCKRTPNCFAAYLSADYETEGGSGAADSCYLMRQRVSVFVNPTPGGSIVAFDKMCVLNN